MYANFWILKTDETYQSPGNPERLIQYMELHEKWRDMEAKLPHPLHSNSNQITPKPYMFKNAENIYSFTPKTEAAMHTKYSFKTLDNRK